MGVEGGLGHVTRTYWCGGQVSAELRAAGVRVTVDDSSNSLGKKIRNAEIEKVPPERERGGEGKDGRHERSTRSLPSPGFRLRRGPADDCLTMQAAA